jgi:hypothetical protein
MLSDKGNAASRSLVTARTRDPLNLHSGLGRLAGIEDAPGWMFCALTRRWHGRLYCRWGRATRFGIFVCLLRQHRRPGWRVPPGPPGQYLLALGSPSLTGAPAASRLVSSGLRDDVD